MISVKARRVKLRVVNLKDWHKAMSKSQNILPMMHMSIVERRKRLLRQRLSNNCRRK